MPYVFENVDCRLRRTCPLDSTSWTPPRKRNVGNVKMGWSHNFEIIDIYKVSVLSPGFKFKFSRHQPPCKSFLTPVRHALRSGEIDLALSKCLCSVNITHVQEVVACTDLHVVSSLSPVCTEVAHQTAMVKAYLRYEFAKSFGVITSNSNILFSADGKSIVSSALENVALWNVKQGNLVSL